MQNLKHAYDERVKAYITAAARAGAECSSIQAELIKEKEGHLAVMRSGYIVVGGGSCAPMRTPRNLARDGMHNYTPSDMLRSPGLKERLTMPGTRA